MMGLLSALLKLPIAPARGVSWLSEQVLQEAERQYYDPEFIRRQLDEVDRLRHEGEIDPDEADQLEEELVSRLLERNAGGDTG